MHKFVGFFRTLTGGSDEQSNCHPIQQASDNSEQEGISVL